MKSTKDQILQRCKDIVDGNYPANGREVYVSGGRFTICYNHFFVSIQKQSGDSVFKQAEFLLGMDQPPAEVDKLAFGIEIVSAMKASAYGVSIEQGRDLALEGTEPDENMSHQHEMFVENERRRLHEQAVFVAEIALQYLSTQKP